MKGIVIDKLKVELFYEDKVWLARFVRFPNLSAFGDTVEEAFKELGNVWNMVKDDYKKL